MSNSDPSPNRRHAIRTLIHRWKSFSNARFDTSDVIQETEYQLWKSGYWSDEGNQKKKLEHRRLVAFTRNTLFQFIRNNLRARRNANCDVPINNTSSSVGLASGARQPVEIAAEREIAEFLNMELAKLSEVDQRIHFLRFHCDKSQHQIASELGLTRRKVETRLKNISNHIRKALLTITENDSD